jgi:hypothetical protein
MIAAETGTDMRALLGKMMRQLKHWELCRVRELRNFYAVRRVAGGDLKKKKMLSSAVQLRVYVCAKVPATRARCDFQCVSPLSWCVAARA